MKPSTWTSGALVSLVTATAMLPFIASVRARGDRGEAATAAEAPKPPETFDAAAIDDYVARTLKAKNVPAAQLVIAKDGKIVLSKAYGEATAETAFAIGSVSKQFTCAAALLLAQDGKLSLEDKVAKYYPDLTRAGEITLDDLGAHLAGYRDYYPLDFVDRRMQRPIEADALIAEYAKMPLDFSPRERWSYSNTGFVILGRAVEKASGATLGAVLAERVFKPLGMTHTSFEPPEGASGLARGYTGFADGPPTPTPREPAHWLHGAGGMFATATDLVTWDLALADGKVLKPESFKTLATTRALSNGRETGYGCGLAIATRAGETVLSHNGAVSGFLTENALVPRTRSAVAFVHDRDDVDLSALFDRIVGLLVKADEPPPPKVAAGSAKDAARSLFVAIQSGKIDRTTLGDDFSEYLTDAKIKDAAARLSPLGEPTSVDVLRARERGAMEASRVRFTFRGGKQRDVSMFRSPSGKIEQFLIGEP